MSAGIDAGCVRLRVEVAGGRVTATGVRSERPDAARALLGRPAEDAPRLVPLLFALCGRAQGRAAELALAAARGEEHGARLEAAIEREAMREHLWRWLLDLPLLLGAAPRREAFVEAARAVAEGRRAQAAACLGRADVAGMARRLGDSRDIAAAAARLLPPLDAAASLACWPRLDDAFRREPNWQGAAAETGALARRPATGARGVIAARWLARLDELRDWCDGAAKVGAGGTASAAPAGPRCGRALVETARGLLMHELELDAGGRIVRYAIVAPTEWNFHPQAALAGWLLGSDAGDAEALAALATRAVAALDPCVRWELEREGW